MKATFEVESIEYTRATTTVKLAQWTGRDHDDERIGEGAVITIFGCRPLNLRPEQLVTLAIHDAPKET